jgi:prepilin-type N-terminal cleavage/methylation domain-containing protein
MRGRVRDSGFSLLEAMIAMAVIAIAIFAVMSMTMTTMAAKESARELQTAKEAAGAKIEELKAKGFASISTTYPTSPNPYTVAFLVNDLINRNTMQPGAVLRLRIDASNPDVYDLLATVEWKGRQGPGSYSMRSLCAR